MSPEAPRPYKRKIILIKKGMQLKLMALFGSMVFIGMVIVAVDMFTSLGRYVAGEGVSMDLGAVYGDAKLAFCIKLVVYVAGVLFVSLVVSHRIAGPVYRFEKTTEEVGKGDLTVRVFLRKGDDLPDLRVAFNDMIDMLRTRLEKELEHAGSAQRLLEEASKDSSLPSGTAEKVRKALAEVQQIGSQFKLK